MGCGLQFGLLKIKFGWFAVMKTHTFGKSMTKPFGKIHFGKVEQNPFEERFGSTFLKG